MVHSLLGAVRSHLGKEGDPTQGDRKGQQGGGTAPAKVGWEEPGRGLGWGLAGSLAEWIGSTSQSGPTRRQQDMTGRRQTFLWAHRASWGPPGHSCAQGSPFLGREVPPIRIGSGAPRAQIPEQRMQLFLLPEACLLPPGFPVHKGVVQHMTLHAHTHTHTRTRMRVCSHEHMQARTRNPVHTQHMCT